jgi:hypothetical protein
MNFSLGEMVALQDVTVRDGPDGSIKDVSPTKFYALSSCVLICFGVYWIATLFSSLASSSFNLRTSELIIQANFAIFVLISLALLFSPWLKMSRYQVHIRGDVSSLFHYQEATVLLFGILFANIPLLFLAKAVSMYEQVTYIQTLNPQVLSYMSSSYFYQVPSLADVMICGLFGAALLVIKTWVFVRVARRFIHNKRFRAAAQPERLRSAAR